MEAKIDIKPSQNKFLALLKDLHEASVIKLTKYDRKLIQEVTLWGFYDVNQQKGLERLRQRWYGPRDNGKYF